MQYFLFYNRKLLLTKNNSIPTSLDTALGVDVFVVGNEDFCVASVDEVPKGLTPVNLRNSYDVLPLSDYKRAGKAAEIAYWNATHVYCSVCGNKLTQVSHICKRCPECGTELWPKLSPAIIVLIHDGEKILLVKSKDFKGDFFGLVAGFVEFGESIEEAVLREVKEETQLEIEDIRYFDSQPWPYPQGLMLGFMAHYKRGNLKLQQSELVSGGWFDIHSLPSIPRPLSMARKLIDAYIDIMFNHNSIDRL